MASVGPVPMPVVVVLVCLLVAMSIARLWPSRQPVRPRPSGAGRVLDMLLVGLLCGRLSFIAANLALYLEAPWSMFQIADGGYHVAVVLVAALGWGIWSLRRQPSLRVPVMCSALAGVLLWVGGSYGLARWQASTLSLPAVQVVDLQGRSLDLEQFQRRPLVLNLWASWCGPCRREMPVLARAQQAHPEVQFVFLNQGERQDEVQQFLQAEHLALRNVLLDEPAAASTALGIRAYPSTLFFDGQGGLQDLHLGELTQAGLEHKLRRLR
ncbi:thiol:disulfide interchange protein [Stenotrophomonas sp. ESTM1D_MKCIP4_1]|uniref:TlpA disulfide reductase family protein n=1 Tax=Stenotrophomonas sp. ESTM1D_MKCIP4_1 TaxID=2072414 RepID=UPI000D53C3D6|nr:TlpA disulfide reductase family protein [Stenotrophomonas sp. ESTM1D_MKCIP4_1]AWH53789.1 thiol:disulfide interchange protein [Stenotrophomonas sp. ESTM1D_MKCIP4_1]